MACLAAWENPPSCHRTELRVIIVVVGWGFLANMGSRGAYILSGPAHFSHDVMAIDQLRWQVLLIWLNHYSFLEFHNQISVKTIHE